MSRLQKIRAEYRPQLPSLLHGLRRLHFLKKEATQCISGHEQIQKLFPGTFGRPRVEAVEGEEREKHPLRIGVVLSGGQASGGHNVITGLFDALESLCPESQLIGFLGGPSGIVEQKTKDLTKEIVAPFRNQGGFDLIGSGRTKIETPEQLAASLETVHKLQLDGLVVVGGDDSNTNAAVLAEYFLANHCKTNVVGVPKTIDGDLKNDHIGVSFGFDTATKTYAEMIGNLERDALSAKKYFHFVRLMGRSASHIALECALATHPNITLIGEEIEARGMTLSQICEELADVVVARSMKKKDFGVALIPEGIVEFIPEMKVLISELNALAAKEGDLTPETVGVSLSQEAQHCFSTLPKEIQKQLLLDRDPHGNVQVSMIETEKLLISMVKEELKKRKFTGKFSPVSHFFGYEGRAGYPSNFDTHYCYALGATAALLIDEGKTGYMTCVKKLHRPVQDWEVSGLPITMLMNMEVRKGKEKPVIQKALVDLDGPAFKFFQTNRKSWALDDLYRFPGPIQFFGESDTTDTIPLSLQLEVQKQ